MSGAEMAESQVSADSTRFQGTPTASGPSRERLDRSAAIDVEHLTRQRNWSRRTFGPGPRTLGVVDHIRKELDEVLAAPADLSEWADVIILAFDGAWRAGHEPEQIIAAVKAKQALNEARTWPDWRTASADVAIEHDRTADAVTTDDAGVRPGAVLTRGRP